MFAMRARVGFVVAALLLLSGCASTRFDAQGHRGARGLAPENTIVAFDKALTFCVDTLEFDVGVTRDGVVVVYHDRTLNADITRDAQGNFLPARGAAIHSLSFDELQRYDVGRVNTTSAYGKPFARQQGQEGVRIPKLSDVFNRYKKANTCGADLVRFNIETKLSPLAANETLPPDLFASALLKEIDAAQLHERVTIQSFDWRTLQILAKTAPQVLGVYLTNEQGANETVQRGKPGASPWFAGFDVDDYKGSVPATIHAAGGRIWSPNFKDLTPGNVAEAKALNLKIIPWTVNDEADMRALIRLGVDGLISDYPDVLQRVRKEFSK
jgi:glycerophosphoryl diester phosphodiesterase